MKKFLCLFLTVIIAVSMLSGCRKTVKEPEVEPSPAVNVNLGSFNQTGDTKPEAKVDETQPEAPEEIAEPEPVEIPVTNDVVRIKESVPDEAKEFAYIRGRDADGNVVWEYKTDEIYVGQYEGISYPWINGDAAYFTCGGHLYAIDIVTENYGQVKWVSEDEIGYGCTMDFDEDGNIYVMSYEGDGYYIFAPDGSVRTHVEELIFDDTEDEQNCFWKNNIIYRHGGYVTIYFDSIEDTRIFNATTGVEGLPEIDFSDLYSEWKIYSYEIDGDYRTGKDIEGDVRIETPDEGDISFYLKDYTSGEVVKYSHMKGVTKLGNMFYGMEDKKHEWYINCRYDEENLFSLGLLDDGRLEVFWYHGPWTSEIYPAVIDMVFDPV